MQLKEENQLLQTQLNESNAKPEVKPSVEEEKFIEEDAIDKAVRPYLEERERILARNTELEQKLQSLLGEYAVMKSDCEIVKTKARSLLIEKDQEIEKIRARRFSKDENEESKDMRSPKSTGTMGDSGASNF